MQRTPKQGEPYQLCSHLRVEVDAAWNFWQVPDFEPWIVLCDECHAAYSKCGAVEMQPHIWLLEEDAKLATDSSTAEHKRPNN